MCSSCEVTANVAKVTVNLTMEQLLNLDWDHKILDPKFDRQKSADVMRKEIDKVCMLEDCGSPLSHMNGPGSSCLCRRHQLCMREYGGLGRLDRPWTFFRKWVCDECGVNVLEEARVAKIKNEYMKRRCARTLIHGDHQIRKADGGRDTEENIKSVCHTCHAIKTILTEDWQLGKISKKLSIVDLEDDY